MHRTKGSLVLLRSAPWWNCPWDTFYGLDGTSSKETLTLQSGFFQFINDLNHGETAHCASLDPPYFNGCFSSLSVYLFCLSFTSMIFFSWCLFMLHGLRFRTEPFSAILHILLKSIKDWNFLLAFKYEKIITCFVDQKWPLSN